MNIFFLDLDPEVSARYHCDKHTCKMIIEYAQLMSTAHRVLDEDECDPGLYKIAHLNHPSNIWVREYITHYQYLYELWANLCEEYTVRYGKTHATWSKLNHILKHPPKNIPVKYFRVLPWSGLATDPPQCMPDEYKGSDTVQAYRKYYLGDKAGFAKWSKTSTPDWWIHVGHEPQTGVYDH